MGRVPLLAALLAALVMIVGTAPASAQVERPEGVTQEMVDQGRQVFTGPGLCSVCHGPQGKGGAIGPDLSDDEWLHGDGSYRSLVQQVLEGVPEPMEAAATMPPRGGSKISDEQVRAVAAYVWSLRNEG